MPQQYINTHTVLNKLYILTVFLELFSSFSCSSSSSCTSFSLGIDAFLVSTSDVGDNVWESSSKLGANFLLDICSSLELIVLFMLTASSGACRIIILSQPV